MALIKEDMDTLLLILHGFGIVTGLITNVQKSMVAPNRCRNIDLDTIPHGFPALRATFPIRYLGLRLLVYHLRSVVFQFIVDKMANKLPIGQGKYITTAGG
jgi:hypothetical protein